MLIHTLMTLSCVYTQLPTTVWQWLDAWHHASMKLLTSLKRLKLNTGKHSSPVLEQRINKVDVSVFVVKGAISPALTLVSTRSSRLPITLEASPVADSIGLSTRSVRRTLTSDVIIFLVNALITSRLDYCNTSLFVQNLVCANNRTLQETLKTL